MAEIIVKQTIELDGAGIEDAIKSYVEARGYEVVALVWPAKIGETGSYSATIDIDRGVTVHVKPVVAKPATKKPRQVRKPRVKKDAAPASETQKAEKAAS